jgi:hypothetical protein
MSISVYAWDSNPAIDRRLYPLSNNRAEQEVLDGISKFIVLANGRTAIQRLPPVERKPDVLLPGESIGKGNIVPFGRVQNPFFMPQRLHYEIPMANDIGLRRHNLYRRKGKLLSHQIRVSARSGMRYAAGLPPTTTFASRLLAG